jgi:hypothetical protein
MGGNPVSAPKSVPFGPVAIVASVVLFSGLGVVIKNGELVGDSIPYWGTCVCLVTLFSGLLSFRTFWDQREDGQYEPMGGQEAILALILLVLPVLSLGLSEEHRPRSLILDSILLGWNILVWTGVLYMMHVDKYEKNGWGTRLGHYLLVFWLVSGVFITIGLQYYTYGQGPVSLLTQVSTYLDLRVTVSGILAAYFVSSSLFQAVRARKPTVPRIHPPQIRILDSTTRHWTGALVLPFVTVANLVLKIAFISLDLIWVITARIAVFFWETACGLLRTLNELVFTRIFAEKIALCLVIGLLLYAAGLMSVMTKQLMGYISSDLGLADWRPLEPLTQSTVGLLAIVFAILVCLSFLGSEILSLREQLGHKATYVSFVFALLCLTGWVLRLLHTVQLPYGLAVPKVGIVTAATTLLTALVALVYGIYEGLRSRT